MDNELWTICYRGIKRDCCEAHPWDFVYYDNDFWYNKTGILAGGVPGVSKRAFQYNRYEYPRRIYNIHFVFNRSAVTLPEEHASISFSIITLCYIFRYILAPLLRNTFNPA